MPRAPWKRLPCRALFAVATLFALICADRTQGQESAAARWGGIDFIKLGKTAAEHDAALAQAREAGKPVLVFFT